MNQQKSPWTGRRVLVTGATGFVGSWLVKALLQRRAFIIALIRDFDQQSELIRSGAIHRLSVVNGCLENFATLERAINEYEVDVVFHLAAQAIVGSALRNPIPTFETNIRGTYHVLEACRVHQGLVKAVVIASSDKAYGDTDCLPYTEAHPLVGPHPYDVSKSCTDLLAASYFHTYGLPIAISRCGNIYGGGDLNWSRIVPGTIRSALHGEAPILRSDGTLVRDYFYVEDAVEAYLTLAEQINRPEVAGQGFNFSTESYVTVREIVETILSVVGASSLPIIIQGKNHGEIQKQSLCAQRAKKILGWTAKYSLVEGMARTVRWYRDFLKEQKL